MNGHAQRRRLAIGALTVGTIAGLLTYGSLPIFQRYVAGVMGILAGSIPLTPQAPGFVLSLAVAFLVGLSMNLLPCNIPIVMTLLPATSGAESRDVVIRRTALYALGALSVLGALGFVLGWAGATLKPLVLGYPQVGVSVAGAVLGTVGLVSIGWGLGELDIVSVPTPTIPFGSAVRERVDHQSGTVEYLLLGAVYGGTGGGCPMPTYHLLLVWVVVAANAVFGAVVLGTYVLGRVLPVAVLGAALHERPTRAAELLGGRYGTLRRINGVVLAAFGSLLLVFAGLRALVGGG